MSAGEEADSPTTPSGEAATEAAAGAPLSRNQKKKMKKKQRAAAAAGGAGEEGDSPVSPLPAATDPAVSAGSATSAASGESGEAAATASAGAKKKKKKKDAAPEKKQSAMGRLAAQRQKAAREEEARLRAEQEEAERKAREEEERLAAEEKRIADEKERKRQAKRERVERMKREGTYKTKSEREKERIARQRLEAMREAGMEVPEDSPQQDDQGQQQQQQQQQSAAQHRPVYRSRRKNNNRRRGGRNADDEDEDGVAAVDTTQQEAEETETAGGAAEEKEPQEDGRVAEAATVQEAKPEEDEAGAAGDGDADVAESWEDDVEDDWEAVDVSTLTKNVKVVKAPKHGNARAVTKAGMMGFLNGGGAGPAMPPAVPLQEDEDLLDQQEEEETVRLRQMGLERQRRKEEENRRQEELAALAAAEAAELEGEDDEAAIELRQRIIEARLRRQEREAAAMAARTPDRLRSPIVVIMGHVDTGKTKLLDKIRHTNVQDGEAGGITQQIGATYFPPDTLLELVSKPERPEPLELRVPGLLVIDTPGHEAFSNLRSRGSSLCDIAILVVDLMHGLEKQTLESITMLRKRRTPFVVALNKIDRCYGWVDCPNTPIQAALRKQPENTVREFKERAEHVKVQLMEQGMNADLYWENEDPLHTVSMVPTSAMTGEGIPDILMMLVQLTQDAMEEKLMWVDIPQCNVMEVKVAEGQGTTLDVILLNGHLHEGDTIVVTTIDGPVVTHIRSLRTPQPSRETRTKGEMVLHHEVTGAMGVRIAAQHLDKTLAGTAVMVAVEGDDVEELKDHVRGELHSVVNSLVTSVRGVLVQASTLGALEALMQFLRAECDPPIPVSGVNIGPVHKRDVMRASTMNDHGCPEYATILAFDVRVEQEAREFAEEMDVRIFTADIIYHLFDQFTDFMEQVRNRAKEDAREIAVFPAIVEIMPEHVYNQKDPIVMGVTVTEGVLRMGTPLSVPALDNLFVGKVTSMERDHRQVSSARAGENVSIELQNKEQPNITFGRHFTAEHPLMSTMTRQSIDALKKHFKNDLSKEEQLLVKRLKHTFGIP